MELSIEQFLTKTFGKLRRNKLLTSLADEPDTSIHVLEKKAQEPNMKQM